MNEIVKKIGWVIAGLVVIGTFYALWEQSQPEQEVYELCKVEVRDIHESITATGHLEAREEVQVKPKATGAIAELLVQAGDRVEKGQALARIQVAPNTVGISEAEGHAATAKLVVDQAQQEYDRAKRLLDKKVLSRQDYERAENALNIARQELKTAQDALQILRTGNSQVAGNATVVVSPIAGTVLDVPVKVGTSVVATNEDSEGTTVAVVAGMDEIIFRGYVDEIEVEKLSIGMPVSIQVGAIKDSQVPAELSFIAPMSQERNGATVFEVKAKAVLPAGLSTRSGYSANAEIVTASYQGVMSVEEAAVEFEADGKAFAWKLTSDADDEDDQEFERVPVVVGGSDGLYIEIKSGVEKGTLLRGLMK